VTEKEILELKTHYADHFEGLHTNIKTLTNYYEQIFTFENMPADVTPYKSPSPRKHIDAAVAHVLGLKESVDMPLPNENKGTKELVQNLINFGTAHLENVNKSRPSNKRASLKHGFLYGLFPQRGPIYVPRLGPEKLKGESQSDYSDRVKEFDKSLEYTTPFQYRNVHPLNILFDDADNPTFVIELISRKALSVHNEFPDWNWGKYSDKPFETVEFWTYWTKDDYCCFVDDNIVKQVDNIHGHIPYTIGDAGYGLDSDSDEPHVRYAGLISPALSAYEMEMRLKTAIIAGFQYGIYGRETVNKEPADDYKPSNIPGELSIVPDHYNRKIEEPPKVLADVYNFLNIIASEQEMVSPKSVMGIASKYERSGYQAAINVGEAQLNYGGLIDSYVKNKAKQLDRLLYLVKNVVKEPVGILGNFKDKSSVTISPNKIDTNIHNYYVVMDALTPEQKRDRIMLGLRLRMSGELDRETACKEFYGLDPEIINNRLLVEQAEQSPTIREAIAMEALKDAGMTDILQMMQSGQISPNMENGRSKPDPNFRGNDYVNKQQTGTQQGMSMPENMGEEL